MLTSLKFLTILLFNDKSTFYNSSIALLLYFPLYAHNIYFLNSLLLYQEVFNIYYICPLKKL